MSGLGLWRQTGSSVPGARERVGSAPPLSLGCSLPSVGFRAALPWARGCLPPSRLPGSPCLSCGEPLQGCGFQDNLDSRKGSRDGCCWLSRTGKFKTPWGHRFPLLKAERCRGQLEVWREGKGQAARAKGRGGHRCDEGWARSRQWSHCSNRSIFPKARHDLVIARTRQNCPKDQKHSPALFNQ